MIVPNDSKLFDTCIVCIQLPFSLNFFCRQPINIDKYSDKSPNSRQITEYLTLTEYYVKCRIPEMGAEYYSAEYSAEYLAEYFGIIHIRWNTKLKHT